MEKRSRPAAATPASPPTPGVKSARLRPFVMFALMAMRCAVLTPPPCLPKLTRDLGPAEMVVPRSGAAAHSCLTADVSCDPLRDNEHLRVKQRLTRS
jgi:hypothetical protein